MMNTVSVPIVTSVGSVAVNVDRKKLYKIIRATISRVFYTDMRGVSSIGDRDHLAREIAYDVVDHLNQPVVSETVRLGDLLTTFITGDGDAR